MIVSHQACASSVGDSTVVDPEAHLPYDKRTETAPLRVGLTGGSLRKARIRLF
jgi:hypothetical protein